LKSEKHQSQLYSLFEGIAEVEEIRLVGNKSSPSALIIFKEEEKANELKKTVDWLRNRNDVLVYSDKTMCQILNGEEYFSVENLSDFEFLVNFKRETQKQKFLSIPEIGKEIEDWINKT
jgi:hypothetical protein